MQTFYVNLGKTQQPVDFVQTWAYRQGGTTLHVGLMPNGAYAIVPNGLPVDREALEQCIPPGPALDQALNWYERREQGQTHGARLRLVFPDPRDDTWRYMDTHQIVESREDLLSALKGGPLQSALIWFESYHGHAQRRQLDEAARAPKRIEEQVRDLLAEQPGWLTEGLAKAVEVAPRVMMEMTRAMEAAGEIVRHGKLWYLPDQDTWGDGEPIAADEA